jgi:hypothetical protein
VGIPRFDLSGQQTDERVKMFNLDKAVRIAKTDCCQAEVTYFDAEPICKRCFQVVEIRVEKVAK